ncbi:UPF0481 protein At3g47200-like [Malus sylvestris]|uniref:UPF0481 protein At3g47200-like n=1 Tax=Malus sylvestris TaxID=3752 RepID=UPI0021ACDDC1|nr:UPF0481 protein At3g47200-like [Malus sylvestris]
MANGGRDHAAIPIPAANHIQATTSLDRRIEETKWLLHPSSGNSSCCIFRVPQHLSEINKKACQPHIVSIGPCHYGDTRLEMMQQHKWRFLRDLLARTPSNGPRLDHYRQVVESMEESIRGCYSETIDLSSHDLVEIMVLDGLFTVELFCKVGRKSPSDPDDLARLSPSDPDDPIFNLAWVFPNLICDLLRLENQIPFFVLQKLFDESKASREDSESSLAKLALEFFNHAVERTDISTTEEKHLLDLLRLSFIPKPYDQSPQGQARNIRPLIQLIRSAKKPLQGTRKAVKKFVAGIKSKTRKGNTSSSIEFIQSAEKLYLAGIKFKTRDAMSFLDIRFLKGVLEIPRIVLDDLRTDLLMNFVAFEQCYFHCSKHVITYAAFMSCLIRTPADVSFLCDKKIIENYLGTDEEAADFFKNLGKDVPFDIDDSYLCELFKDVNEYHRNIWHVRWAGLRFKYFSTPWSFLSAVAAVVLLLLTAIQVFLAWYAYVRPPKSGG